MFSHDDRHRVMARCRRDGAVVATHAVMAERVFLKTKGDLGVWCSRCRSAHRYEVSELWLEGSCSPVEKPQDQEAHARPEGQEKGQNDNTVPQQPAPSGAERQG